MGTVRFLSKVGSCRRAGCPQPAAKSAPDSVQRHRFPYNAVGALIERPPLRRSARIDMACSKIKVPARRAEGTPPYAWYEIAYVNTIVPSRVLNRQ